MKTLILTCKDIRKFLNMRETIDKMEEAFKLHALGKVQMPPKSYLIFDKGDLRAMPACLGKYAGIKWVNSHPENYKFGLPTVMAVYILNDVKTGFPLAIMEASELTNYRTGATGGLAAKYLARKDSEVIGFIGCGRQAYTQFLALKEEFEIKEVKAYDINESSAKKFVEFVKSHGIEGKVMSAKETCQCDILVTTTPSRKPVVKDEWIKEGMHINAIGADGPGKQELDEKILLRAKIVVDDIEQAVHGGEINVAISKGLLRREDIYATLGEVILGKKVRESEKDITIFDSTGLAIQDVALASLIYEKAKRENVGLEIDLFNLE
ncbi:alanine dehydrogenase [Methanocaldococcus infernus ME]|uniref:Alanine dehydrogenase n=1 Tax=Methanocaldococcus infernus (strain DSM 11812 / JCM 15783 / ME) TaxID=573063 RepID=D5VS75_METIM|nr:alanine dehydrogenase [Methanocaldococcus infernus]ADG13428.1 alanine dehydrogenase [Methanocaldococcus infernus ME]